MLGYLLSFSSSRKHFPPDMNVISTTTIS